MKLGWKIALFIAACIALVLGTAIAWHVHKAKANERMLVETARVTLVRAQQGDAIAQYHLATMYSLGRGVPKSDTEALRWLRKAAEQGDAKAQSAIGSIYYYGQGVPQDYAESLRWFRKSADQGYAKAQDNLGSMYYYANSVPQDYTEALRWYRLAADQGDAPAQEDLGGMYYYGRGVPQDDAQAFNWYRKAANQGYARAQFDLGYMYNHGRGVPQSSTEALRWYRKAAVRDDEYAKRALRLKMSAFEITYLTVMFLGSLYFLIFSQLTKNRIHGWQRRCAALVGILILVGVGLELFRYSNIGILLSLSTSPTLVFARFLLAGIVIALLLIFVELKSLKRVLQISVMSFIAFNLFAIVIHNLGRFSSVNGQNCFIMINGNLIGLILVLAIFLWRTNPGTREFLPHIGDPAAPDPSPASGTDSNP